MLVIIPDSGHELLRKELAYAFAELGHEVRRVCPQAFLDVASPDYLPRLLELGPGLFFSVNLMGLLPGGAVPKLLHEAGVPVIGWFVDNPWHVLSGMRDPSWKNFFLAVTDHTFVEPLEQAVFKLHQLAGTVATSIPGQNPQQAPQVFHLPLAACPRCIDESRVYTNLHSGQGDSPMSHSNEIVFAGRSVFSEYANFFAGQSIPHELLGEAESLCASGTRADFDWWSKRMGLPGERGFWPGKTSRVPGLGAASSNRIWRRQRLLAALEVGLTIYGDEGWLQLVCDAQSATADLHRIIDAPELNAADKYDTSVCCPGLDLRQPFDYYAHIYEIYSSAPFTLNLNSLLMNAGLTQRIFDVWLTGGFCLTDDSPGLFIFPEELTRAVTFRTPEELPELVRRFKESPDAKEETRRAWQSEILKKHTYRTRLETLLEQVEQACKQRQEQ